MQSYQFFDIHTHNPSHRVDVLEIVNARPLYCNECNEKWYSLGVHPYDITSASDVSILEDGCFVSPRLVAIGETGLDFRFQATIARQRDFFERQIDISNRLELPLIVHSVRALPETLAVLRRSGAERFVFHGFASDVGKAGQIFSAGGFVSIGPMMLQSSENQRFVNNIFELQSNSILLETDDGLITIEEVYFRVSEILDIQVCKLKEIIQKNFTTLYGERIKLFSE